MNNPQERAWLCLVCSYLHNDPEEPELCPVCGAGKTEFELREEAPKPTRSEAVAADNWQCLICEYFHDGNAPPEICPVCGATKLEFKPVPQTTVKSPTEQSIRAVIVGGGVAGVAAAEVIRQTTPQSEITLVCSENHLPYYRLNLTRYLAGEIVRDTLPIHPETWYQENQINLIVDQSVESMDPAQASLQMSDGRQIPYEKLILATGSHPYLPPLPGINKQGVRTLRTTDDAEAILEAVRQGQPCVCIGGGVLGMETAGALARQGADVTMLESHNWLMPRQLNPAGAGILEKHMAELGVKVLKQARSAAIEGQQSVTGVRLQDGQTIPAKLVIIATGVRPNTVLARKIGLEVNDGIVVDNHLRTSQPNIFAAGDAAEHNGRLYGSWAPAQFQGRIAGLNAVGVETAFSGLPRTSMVKALGLDIASFGKFMPEDGSYIVVEEKGERKYTQFVFHDGRLVGAILIGQPGLAATTQKAMEENTDFSRTLLQNPGCRDIIKRLQ